MHAFETYFTVAVINKVGLVKASYCGGIGPFGFWHQRPLPDSADDALPEYQARVH